MDPRHLAAMSFLDETGVGKVPLCLPESDEDAPLINVAVAVTAPPPQPNKKRAAPRSKAPPPTEGGEVGDVMPKAPPRKRAPPKSRVAASADPTATHQPAIVGTLPSHTSFQRTQVTCPIEDLPVAAALLSLTGGGVPVPSDDDDAPIGAAFGAAIAREDSLDSVSVSSAHPGSQELISLCPSANKASHKGDAKGKDAARITKAPAKPAPPNKAPKKVAATQDEVNAAVLAWFRREMKPATPQSCVDGLQSKYSKTFVLRALEELQGNNSLATKDIKKVRLYFLNRDKPQLSGCPVGATEGDADNANSANCITEAPSTANPETSIDGDIAVLQQDVSALTEELSRLSRLQNLISSLKPTSFYRREIESSSVELAALDARLKTIEESLTSTRKAPAAVNGAMPPSATASFGRRDIGWFRLKRSREGDAATTSAPRTLPDARTQAQDALALIKQWTIRKRLCMDMLASLNVDAASHSCNFGVIGMLALDEDEDEPRLTPELCKARIPNQLLQPNNASR